jgi:hypothetical protein
MVKFCETRFAQSELGVYKNFEKNYNTYRRTWGVDAEVIETEFTSAKSTIATTSSATTTKEAPIAEEDEED